MLTTLSAGGSGAAAEQRHASGTSAASAALLKDLPLLRDAPAPKREALFKQKLALCTVTDFNWDDPESDRRGKEIKRATLLELVDFLDTPTGQKMFTEAVYGDCITMVSANIFRALAPSGGGGSGSGSGGEEVTGVSGGEGEDDEVYLEPSWPHLQLVYEFLLRFVVSGEVKVKAAKKWVSNAFCTRLIDMFDSEDPRERDYLKVSSNNVTTTDAVGCGRSFFRSLLPAAPLLQTILHRIYGKFMTQRSLIRKAIANVFYTFVLETERHNGISELLEILGSIINGFALPLKPEHVVFLEKALIPLHRPRSVNTYFQPLCYCVIQYIEKDPTTVVRVVEGLVRRWPWSSSAKQMLLINELEELLELAGPEAVQPAMHALFATLAKCVGSTHFQVAERALFLWNNEQLISTGVLSKAHTSLVLPLLFAPLHRNATGHWNSTVETLSVNVLKHYQDADPELYVRCEESLQSDEAARVAAAESRQAAWAALEEATRKAAPAAPAAAAAVAAATSVSTAASSSSSSADASAAASAANGAAPAAATSY